MSEFNQIPTTWEEELQKMELEKEYARGKYLDMVAEQEQQLLQDERYRIITEHKLDCVFLKYYGMSMDATREFYKDDSQWVYWFSERIDTNSRMKFTDNDIESLLSNAPNQTSNGVF